MAKYTKRSDGRYVATLNIDGKRKYFYSTSERELDIIISEFKVNRAHGTISKDTNITFKDYAEKWFERNITTKEYGTQINIKNMLKNHIYPEIGYIKLKDLKSYHIQDIVKTMADKDLKDIVKRTVSTIKRILDDAMKNDVIYKNVAINIYVPKTVKNERRPLSTIEDRLVVANAKKHKYGLFILLIRYTGIRSEEAVPLLLTDFDLKKKTLSINKAVTFIKNQPHVKPTKNLKSRTIPIPDLLIPYLKTAINKQKTAKIPYLFTKETDTTKMLSKTALRTHLNSFLHVLNKGSKIEVKFTYHQLRHSYCTMLYYAGIKIKKAQELMGHSSADMVYNIYTHLDETRENAERQINNYIKLTLSKTLSNKPRTSKNTYSRKR